VSTAPIRTDGPSRDEALTIDALRREGFDAFVTFAALRSNPSAIAAAAGVYVVLRRSTEAPSFLETSCGGHFKGRNPTARVDALERKWVPTAQVVYIGKGDRLQRRLRQYADFGASHPVGHWGGRYVWQLADSDQLLVAWKTCGAGETAAELEAALVGRFKRAFGRLPFANIADPSK